MNRVALLTTVTLLGTTACQQAETPEQTAARIERESAAARTAIEAQDQRFSQFMAAGQTDSMVLIYTEDAELLAPNSPPVRGRAAIAEALGEMARTGSFTLTLTAEEVVANGPHAVESGRYTMAFTPGPDAPSGITAAADTGKFLVHWRNEGGQWLMAHDMWSSNRPADPAPEMGPDR